MFAWSYSALTAFEQCPKKYAATRIFKLYKEPESEAMLYGQRVHKSLEMRVKAGAILPDDVKHLEPTVAKLLTVGECRPEERYALDKSFRTTDYFDKPTTMPDHRVWLRIVIDLQVMLKQAPIALLIDYKTGKVKEDLDQLKLFAATMFAMHPHLKECRTGYLWTAQNQMQTQRFERDEAPVIWREFMPRVARMENAVKTNAYPANPSGLCKAHCPVRDCAFYGKGSR